MTSSREKENEMETSDPTMVQPTVRDLLESAVRDLASIPPEKRTVATSDALASVRTALDMLPARD